MTRPTLITGQTYRILTKNGRVWERVQFDGRRLAFVLYGHKHGEPRTISLDVVERISPRAHDREGSGAVGYRDVGEWCVQEAA